MNTKDRREFLKRLAGLGGLGVGSHLTRLGMMSAKAQTNSQYKAMVCVFLFGGNDSNNMIVPIDSRYGAYATMRGGAALSQASLLPAGGTGYAFHPRLSGIQRLYNQGRAAMVFNVGMLVRPTTRATLDSAPLPRNLFSHDDQQKQWQTSDPNGGASGWGGRLNERVLALNSGSVPPGIAMMGGNEIFLSGLTTAPANLSDSNAFGLSLYGGGGATRALANGLERIVTFDSGVRMVGAANGVLEDAIRNGREFNAALTAAPAPAIPFPGGKLSSQLAQVVRLMSARGTLGMNRQIFFAGVSGYDNHSDLLPLHNDLMGELDGALSAFFANLESMGLMNNVTLFTESEFNRTGNMNSQNGTDHAWGGHQLVFGGAVRPGTYGTFPTHLLRGPDDASDRGSWIPTTSVEQYAATLGSWYGVSDSDLSRIFPNLANFAPLRLPFL